MIINFKLNISQNMIGLKKLFEALDKANKKYRSYFGSDLLKNKKYLHLFNESNVVLLNQVRQTGPLVRYFTRNAPKLLKISSERIQGMNIKQVLTPQLALKHDNLILDFMNRKYSEQQETVGVCGSLIDGFGFARLVNVVIKLEPILNENIFLSAMIIPYSKQNTEFIVFEVGSTPAAFSEALSLRYLEL